MIDLETLLKPISPEAPCGEDLSYDARFHELETLVRGKEATQFSEAEEPDWKAVRTLAIELLGRSKDLRIVVILTLALLKLEGIPGFRDGVVLLQRLLAQSWQGLYPRLDPDDNNDPTERINIISSLATPIATFGDPARFLERLRQAPLTASARVGRFSLADMSPNGASAGQTPVDSAQVQAAFRDTSSDHLQSLERAVTETRASVIEIDAFLTSTVGSDHAPDMDRLNAALKELDQVLRPYVGGAVVQATTGGNAPSDAASEASFSGTIRSREDVVRLLEEICAYYARTEPASPIPLLLRRAQRLVSMDFLQIINDLTPEALAQVLLVAGQRPTTEQQATDAGAHSS